LLLLLLWPGVGTRGAYGAEESDLPVLSDLAQPLTLEIAHGTCLVWSKPVYCSRPGEGYRLVVENGLPDGTRRVRRWAVTFDGGDPSGGPANLSDPAQQERPLRLEPRQQVCLVLEGEPGSFVRCRIEGEAVPEARKTVILEDGTKMVIRTRTVGRPTLASAHPVRFDPERPDPDVPAPGIEFTADRTSLVIGEAATLRWQVEGAESASLSLPQNLRVPAAGSAILFPEADATVGVSALSPGGRTERKLRLQVAVPEPELEVKIEPGTIDAGQQATLSWTSRNARMVLMEGSLLSPLPLHGKMAVGLRRLSGGREGAASLQWERFTLEAVCGTRRVSRSVTLEVVDPEERKREEAEQAQQEARLRTIEPEDDRAIQARFEEFRRAMGRKDASAATACVFPEWRETFCKFFPRVAARFTERGWDSLELFFVLNKDGAAIYVLGPKGAAAGKVFHDEDAVCFVRDDRGQWWVCLR